MNSFPADTPYMGYEFYLAHSDNGGDSALSQQNARAILEEKLASQINDGLVVEENSEGEVGGEHCYTFISGVKTGDSYTAREQFAVTDSGSIFVLDRTTDEYVPYNMD